MNQYGNIIAQLTDNNYYDAEAVVSPDGKKILHTSMESGDLDIYIMDVDGSNKKRVSSVKNVNNSLKRSFDDLYSFPLGSQPRFLWTHSPAIVVQDTYCCLSS